MRKYIGLIVIGLIAWLALGPVRRFVSEQRRSAADSPKGQWVGELEIMGGYAPRMPGLKWPHEKTAIHFSLDVEDQFMDRYSGEGSMCIEGDATPHPVHIGAFDVQPEREVVNGRLVTTGQRVKMVLRITSKPSSADDSSEITGQYMPQEIVINTTDPGDIELRGKLHRGTKQDYDRICQSLAADMRGQQPGN